MVESAERLQLLIKHLKSHNEEHAKELIEMAEKAKELGYKEVCNLLLQSREEMRMSNMTLQKAYDLLIKEKQ